MALRAVLLLSFVLGASAYLTWHFGADVLLALGLILTQLKILGQKLLSIELPAILVWLKTQTAAFFRFELIKKYFYSAVVPLLMGPVVKRRIEAFLTRYKSAMRSRYDALITWYNSLEWYEKTFAAIVVLAAMLGLSVTSLGLWLVLFSVKLPFWVIAAASATGRMIWSTITKTAFKTIAFLQLGWFWRLIRRRLPDSYLDRQRRFEYRLARRVVRQRRMTLKQLEAGHNSLALRWALLMAYFRSEKPAGLTDAEFAAMGTGRAGANGNTETEAASNTASEPAGSSVQPAPPRSKGSETTAQPAPPDTRR